MAPASASGSRFLPSLSSCPDFLRRWTKMWKCKPNKPLPPQVTSTLLWISTWALISDINAYLPLYCLSLTWSQSTPSSCSNGKGLLSFVFCKRGHKLLLIPRQMPGINFSAKTEEWANVGMEGYCGLRAPEKGMPM